MDNQVAIVADFQGTMDIRVRRQGGRRTVTITVHVDEGKVYDPVPLFYLALGGLVSFHLESLQLAMDLDQGTGELSAELGPGAAG